MFLELIIQDTDYTVKLACTALFSHFHGTRTPRLCTTLKYCTLQASEGTYALDQLLIKQGKFYKVNKHSFFVFSSGSIKVCVPKYISNKILYCISLVFIFKYEVRDKHRVMRWLVTSNKIILPYLVIKYH